MSLSIYEFKEIECGFTVGGKGQLVIVKLSDTKTCIEVSSTAAAKKRLGLYEYYDMSDRIIELLKPEKSKPLPTVVRKAINSKTGKALGHRLHHYWLRMIMQAPSIVRSVQKAVFAATFGCSTAFFNKHLYEKPELCRDIVAHRARLLFESNTNAETTNLLNNMYAELAVTLDSLPGGVTYTDVMALRYVRLPKPVKTRKRLIIVSKIVQFYYDPAKLTKTVKHNLQILLTCSEYAFDKACAEVCAILHIPLNSLRKYKYLDAVAAAFRSVARPASDISDYVLKVQKVSSSGNLAHLTLAKT